MTEGQTGTSRRDSEAGAQYPMGDSLGGRMKTKVTKKAVPPPSSPPHPTLESAHGPDNDYEEEEPPETGEVVPIIRGNSTATTPKITFGRVIKVVDRDIH